MSGRTYVFGYGSLARSEGVPCRLRGFARGWDVAMDNTRTIAGYKVYEDPATGERPAVFVTFLSIRTAGDGVVNGVAFPVGEELLAPLDVRERNYERREVTDLVDVELGAHVWAYLGTEAARERFETGRAADTAVVSEEYHDRVLAAFARLGPLAVAEFERTTDPLAVPRRALTRVDLPG